MCGARTRRGGLDKSCMRHEHGYLRRHVANIGQEPTQLVELLRCRTGLVGKVKRNVGGATADSERYDLRDDAR